ncbi:MAG: hypothetical protein EXS15_08200, partial [Phycisphaerales bacterium]|nr:hypothetical protein [Phycisphaerales bacterium]
MNTARPLVHRKLSRVDLVWQIVAYASIAVTTGCAIPLTKDSQGSALESIACESPRQRPGYGPPPYEYWRIVGGTVPAEGFALEPALASVAPMLWTFVGPRPVTSEYWSGNANAGGRVPSI